MLFIPALSPLSGTALAPPVAILRRIDVVGIERMAVDAMRLVRVLVSAVPSSVFAVLRRCAVQEVRQGVVRRIAIVMTNMQPLWSRSDEGSTHQRVPVMGLVDSSHGELVGEVSGLSGGALQNSALQHSAVSPGRSGQAAHSSKIGNFVESFVSHDGEPVLGRGIHTRRCYVSSPLTTTSLRRAP